MIVRRGAGIIVLIVLFLIFGCGREKPKTDFELGKEYFLASDYPKAMIRLEKWVQQYPDSPQNSEAHAMLAVIYHDDETRQTYYKAEIDTLKKIGEPAMSAVLKMMENLTTATRLGNTIRDILVEGGQLSVNPLITHLKGHNWRLRRNAQETLTKMGSPAVEALIKALDDPDVYVRSLAIEALSEIGDKRAIEPLEKQMEDPDKLIQVTAAAALHKMGRGNPRNIIINAMTDDNAATRRVAAKAIWEIIDNPPLSLLLKAMKDSDPDVRNYVTLAVGKTRNPEAIGPLIKALKEDEDDRVRDSAAKALHQIGTPAVDPLIKELAGTKDMEIVIRIAQTLGDIGDKRAIKPLEKVYNEATNPLLKNETAKALNKID